VWTGKFTDVSDKRVVFIFKQYLRMKAISFETSVTLYQSTRCNIQEDFNLQQHDSEKAVRTSNLTRGMSVQIIPSKSSTKCALAMIALTLTLLMWRIW